MTTPSKSRKSRCSAQIRAARRWLDDNQHEGVCISLSVTSRIQLIRSDPLRVLFLEIFCPTLSEKLEYNADDDYWMNSRGDLISSGFNSRILALGFFEAMMGNLVNNPDALKRLANTIFVERQQNELTRFTYF